MGFSAVAGLPFTDTVGNIALAAFLINLAAMLTLVLRAIGVPDGGDEPVPEHYHADADE